MIDLVLICWRRALFSEKNNLSFAIKLKSFTENKFEIRDFQLVPESKEPLLLAVGKQSILLFDLKTLQHLSTRQYKSQFLQLVGTTSTQFFTAWQKSATTNKDESSSIGLYKDLPSKDKDNYRAKHVVQLSRQVLHISSNLDQSKFLLTLKDVILVINTEKLFNDKDPKFLKLKVSEEVLSNKE